MTWGSNDDRTPHQIHLDRVSDKRRRDERIRAVFVASIVLFAAVVVGTAGYSLIWLLLHLPETIGHAAGRLVRAYNEVVR